MAARRLSFGASLLLSGLCCLLPVGCQQALDAHQAEDSTPDKTQTSDSLLYVIAAGEALAQQLKAEDSNWDALAVLLPFYQQREHQLLWQDSAKRKQVEAVLRLAYYQGLHPARYAVPSPEKPEPKQAANADIALSDALLRYTRDRCHGVYTTDSFALDWLPTQRVPDWRLILDPALASASREALWQSWEPQQQPYQVLLSATQQFVTTFPDENHKAQVPTEKEDSTLAKTLVCELLLHRGWLDSASTGSYIAIETALKRFQEHHGLTADGKVGRYTAAALGRSNRSRWRSLASTLERWRLEDHWPEPFAWVPLPHFTLFLVDDDTILFSHRVVIGTTKNPTPEITSKIDLMVAYPYWYVPFSISSKEILPKIQSDSTYLARNGYLIRDRSGQEVDPKSVDWNQVKTASFPYSVRQAGGAGNALGLIKFIFPNSHAVYLHDTNAKKYFSFEQRAYSHGCVRLERPMDFAAYLLGREDGSTTMSDVRAAIAKRKERKIPLRERLPIYLRHFSTIAGADGLPVFGTDLYGMDAAFRAESQAKKARQKAVMDSIAALVAIPAEEAPLESP